MSQLDAVLSRIDADLEAASSGCSGCSGSSRSPPTLPTPPTVVRAEDLKSIEFEASAHTTPGHPIVVGHAR